MICSRCKGRMVSGEQDGKPVYVCVPCSAVVQIPMAGAATDKPRVQRQENVQVSPSQGEVSLQEALADYCPSLEFVTEYKFSFSREFRLDVAHPKSRVAIEMEGYGHQKDNRYKSDLDKYNLLAFEGWALFRCTKSMLEKDAERFVRMVAECIRKRLKESSASAQ